ncbi:MAG TPA: lysophospholipid acyltransferase family protein [Dermatophilaceae bacterium]|nr:lysophospholipid acyltransferase family protein [Dermatophilaceae bacterium]
MPLTQRGRLPRSYRFVAGLIRPLLKATTKQQWSGAEHLPKDGGFVVCPNHLSYIDPLTFAHFLYDNGAPPFFLAKEGLFRIPVVGRLITAAQQIPVYREGRRAGDAFQAAVAAVQEGKCVPIFPEGTLTRDPGLWPMTGKTGAARVALATRCPVIPVAQWGPQRLLPPYAKAPKLFPRKTMRVVAGPPVDLSDLYAANRSDARARHEATDRIMAAITTLLEDIRQEQAPATRFDPRSAGLPATGNPRKRRRIPPPPPADAAGGQRAG